MERNKLYTVTKASSDDVIRLGDLIWLSEDDTLNSIMYMGTCLRKNWDVPVKSFILVTVMVFPYHLEIEITL